MGPKGSQYEPEGHQKGPNMGQEDAKMTPKGAKGAAKSDPKINKNTSKNPDLEKGRKRGCATLSFEVIFDLFLVKNASKNRCEKRCQKRLQKSRKLSKKQGTIPSQEMHFLIGCLQRRFLRNSVFTREKQGFLKIACFESVHTFEKRPRKK